MHGDHPTFTWERIRKELHQFEMFFKEKRVQKKEKEEKSFIYSDVEVDRPNYLKYAPSLF